MAEMRRVKLSDAAVAKGVTTSNFWFNNLNYRLEGLRYTPVSLEIANSWVAADSNVIIAESDKE